MSVALLESLPKSRLKALLDHFGQIEDPREPWRVAHPLPEVLLLVVCGTICDCEDYDLIAEWGEEHLAVLRRYLPSSDAGASLPAHTRSGTGALQHVVRLARSSFTICPVASPQIAAAGSGKHQTQRSELAAERPVHRE